jgi:hypothetical protein
MLVGLHESSILVMVGALFAAACAIAHRVAEARFERRVHEAGVDAARRLLDRIDLPSLVLGLGGLVAFTTLFAVATLVVGGDEWSQFWDPSDPAFDAQLFFGDRIRDLAIVLPLLVVAAVAVGRACRRGGVGVLEDRRTIGFAAVLGLTTLVVGAIRDSGSVDRYWEQGIEPATCLRTLLTVSGALALFVVTSGFMLARRRGEQERITPAT